MSVYTSEYQTARDSIPSHNLDRSMYFPAGVGCNYRFAGVRIRQILSEKTGLVNLLKGGSSKDDSGNDWIWIANIPRSDCKVSFLKSTISNRTETKIRYSRIDVNRILSGISEPQRVPVTDVKSEEAFFVVLDNPITYVSFWRVFSIEEALNKIKYWIDRFQGITCIQS